MSTILAPDVRRILADLARRIGILERRVSNAVSTVDTTDEIIFSYAGTLTTTTSPPARSRQGGILAVVAVTLGTAGSTGTTLLVKKNGTTVQTISVPSSTTVYNADIGARFAADADVLTLTISAAGTGAADMTAAARFTS